jgi:adenosylhomocysteine nucleosidase
MESSSSARRVALLAPMRSELLPLVRRLALRRAGTGKDAHYAGAIGRVEIVAVQTGIGVRPAARAVERVLALAAIEHVVVVGVAGGIGASVAIGDLVVPESVVDLETGARFRPARLGATPPRGTLLTSDGLLTDPARFARFDREGAVAIDMETSAVAAACERRGCPWSVFRAISDHTSDGSIDQAIFGLTGPDGQAKPAAVARFLLTQPWRIPQLARLARGLRLATDAAADACARALETL